jgi:hypothetical protein
MATKEELQERAQLVRIHEANCKIEYPSPDELNYRIAIMKKLGVLLGLKEVRTATIGGPVIETPKRPGQPPVTGRKAA